MLDSVLPWILIFIFGAAIGSFLNVVIYRLPAGRSLLFPSSHCPRCRTSLKFYDNVPILGWLWLKGRCRYCQVFISPRYPLVELGCGLLFVALFSRFGWQLETPAYWILASWLVALTMIDLDTMTLPNSLTTSGICLGWCVHSVLAITAGQSIVSALAASLAASVFGLWLFDGISLFGAIVVGKTVMGGGDGKLAAMLGAWLGWQGLLLSVLLASILGALLGSLGVAIGLLNRRQPIPFGPFLAFGTGINIFWGNALINGYLELLL